jgi:putative ABC transport system ATP-binding protein
MECLVELETVTKSYGGGEARPALNAVSLCIPAGEITGIMGPSGSGKSTLLNVVAGLDRVSSGSVRVAGLDITHLSEARLSRYRRSSVGLIFQFFNLLNTLTVLENVLLPAQLGGMRRAAAIERARELLQQLDIEDQTDKYPPRISGGQRQRVAIARALVNRPVLLLADEPTGALDTRSGESVIDLLLDLNRAGQTIVLVTHDARLAERCTNHVISLVDGCVEGAAPALGVAR